MTQDTQAGAGAGAQPAPALQPEALRIAMHLRQRAQLSRPGNLDTLSASGANELERQHTELATAQAEAKHWRSNHDNVVARLRIFTQRTDIPKELADRLPWYRELVRLQEFEAQALQQSAEITDAEIDRIAESMPGGLDGFLKAWGWRQFARAILQAVPLAPAQQSDFTKLVQAAQAFVLDPASAKKKLELEAVAWGPLAAQQADPPAPAAVAVPGDLEKIRVGRLPTMNQDEYPGLGDWWVQLRIGSDGNEVLARVYGNSPEQAHARAEALAAAPAQEHATQLAGQALPADEFRGDTASLVRNIVALLDLDAQGCLVPHGVGGHARGLLSAAASRLAAAPAQAQEDARIAKLTTAYAELSNMFHDQIVAQQAAWIEWQHGEGAEAAMGWIENGLCGPGHIPDEDAPYGKEAQAWYDANNSDPFPVCQCGRPSNIMWMGMGFCCKVHHDAARAAQGGAA